jgi:hypothetical protein
MRRLDPYACMAAALILLPWAVLGVGWITLNG